MGTWLAKTKHIIFHGKINEKRQREGWKLNMIKKMENDIIRYLEQGSIDRSDSIF